MKTNWCLVMLAFLLAGCTLAAPAMVATPPVATAPLSPPAAAATTYYVRPDGGSYTQCNGRVDAPYPGTGTDQPCAWNHPFQALPPASTPRISGGDTLIIASGEYMMGYGAPEANLEDDICARDYPGGCHMSPIPSGPDPAHPTRILGAGWDSGC
ncbi:MAG: hypothetical protein OEW09_09275, partial [Anaerolineae bacterium]|nr:hypothetical protein [Anaerolineae bacterium]